jgi:hypothetical protein
VITSYAALRAVRDILGMVLGIPLVLVLMLAAFIDADGLASRDRDHREVVVTENPALRHGGRLVLQQPSVPPSAPVVTG